MKRWSILEVLNWTTNYFKSKKIETPRLDAEVLLAEVLGCSRLDLYLNYNKPLTKEELASYHQMVKRRSFYEPIAYIIGYKEFFGYNFKVNRNVLIPRPETELLVEKVIERAEDINGEREKIIVDVGTGSGNIAISLAKSIPSYIYAIDVSKEILDIAIWNAKNLGAEERINFLKGDLLNPLINLDLEGKIHFIVSNPPYIPSKDLNSLPIEIKNYEPLKSLDGGKEGVHFHNLLIRDSLNFLRKGGYLLLEIGEDQSNFLGKILEEVGYKEINIIKDYSEKERIIEAKKE